MKRIFAITLSLVCLISAFSSSAIDLTSEKTQDEIVTKSQITMDTIQETFSSDEVKILLSIQKAQEATPTNQFVHYSITDSEVEEFYKNVYENVTRAPGLAYYFSRIYWRMRYCDDYGKDVVTLTMVPTDYMKAHTLAEEVAAVWLLVKAEHSSSQYWTNEVSIERQFSCHALGERWLGDVGEWDIEPIRPATGLAQTILAKCNPT